MLNNIYGIIHFCYWFINEDKKESVIYKNEIFKNVTYAIVLLN
jgi:hypothetical protein